MAWLPRGYFVCDSCGIERPCVEDKQMSIQLIRAGGWHHAQGKTMSGKDYETVLCPGCARNERRRTRNNEKPQQEGLPLDWEKHRIVPGGQGIASR